MSCSLTVASSSVLLGEPNTVALTRRLPSGAYAGATLLMMATLLIGPRGVNDGLRRGDAVGVARESRELREWDLGKSGERGSHRTELIRVVDAVYSGG